MINLCRKKNGGCHTFARCNTTDPGVRTCTCHKNYVGDGLTCRGTVEKEIVRRELKEFFMGLMVTQISLKGRGPFTVFVPTTEAYREDKHGGKFKFLGIEKHLDEFGSVMRSHIVMCHTLLPIDLSRPRNLTTLSGLVLTTRVESSSTRPNVTYSNDLSTNGIFHEIDKILYPPQFDAFKDLDVPVSPHLRTSL
nr:stabilin-2-like [Labrus bergylta]